MSKITKQDLSFEEIGYYSIIINDIEYVIEPILFGGFSVGKYGLNSDLIGRKIPCESFEEALLELNKLCQK